MKQSKKLTRAHLKFLENNGIASDVINTIRFYREHNGEYIFIRAGEPVKVVAGELVKV